MSCATSFPFLLYSDRKAISEAAVDRPVAIGESAGSLSLRRPLWRWEGGGTQDLCSRCVYRVCSCVFLAGGDVEAEALPGKNKVAAASSPLRCGVVLHWGAVDVWCLWIWWSCELLSSSGGRCGGVGVRAYWGFCPPALRRCTGVSSSGGVGFVRWCVGGGRLLACGTAAAVSPATVASAVRLSSRAQVAISATTSAPGRPFWASLMTS